MSHFTHTSRFKDMYTKLAFANNNYACSDKQNFNLSKVCVQADSYFFAAISQGSPLYTRVQWF